MIAPPHSTPGQYGDFSTPSLPHRQWRLVLHRRSPTRLPRRGDSISETFVITVDVEAAPPAPSHHHHHRHQRCAGHSSATDFAVAEATAALTTNLDELRRPNTDNSFTASHNTHRDDLPRGRWLLNHRQLAFDSLNATDSVSETDLFTSTTRQLRSNHLELDFLADGESITFTYVITVDDGSTSAPPTTPSPSPSPAPTMRRSFTAINDFTVAEAADSERNHQRQRIRFPRHRQLRSSISPTHTPFVSSATVALAIFDAALTTSAPSWPSDNTAPSLGAPALNTSTSSPSRPMAPGPSPPTRARLPRRW